MANITRYRTAKGENRYRVRYRKPDGTQTDKRGFRRKFTALDLDLLMAVIAVCLAPAVHPIAADIILTALAVWAMRNSR